MLKITKLRETLVYHNMPKCKNVVCSQSAAKEMKNIKITIDSAYIIGVYLGDGSIGTDKRTFCLQSIDKDFCEITLKSLTIITKNNPRLVQMNRLTTAKRIVWGLYLTDKELCDFLKEITHDRKELPKDIYNWDNNCKRSLIAGLLDSEGYVGKGKIHYSGNHEVCNLSIGIGACDKWLLQLHQLCSSMGVKVGVIVTEYLKSGKDFYRFIFNKKSFISSDLYFTIKRKMDRIEEYKRLFPGSTTTRNLPKTEHMRQGVSRFAITRSRIGGRFVKMGSDIV